MSRPFLTDSPTPEEEATLDDLCAVERLFRRLARQLVAETCWLLGLTEREVDLVIETFPIDQYDVQHSAQAQVLVWLDSEHGIDIVFEHGKVIGLWS